MGLAHRLGGGRWEAPLPSVFLGLLARCEGLSPCPCLPPSATATQMAPEGNHLSVLAAGCPKGPQGVLYVEPFPWFILVSMKLGHSL